MPHANVLEASPHVITAFSFIFLHILHHSSSSYLLCPIRTSQFIPSVEYLTAVAETSFGYVTVSSFIQPRLSYLCKALIVKNGSLANR
jgi:hypothetical protein